MNKSYPDESRASAGIEAFNMSTVRILDKAAAGHNIYYTLNKKM